jgi:hypothetical protein
LLNRPTPDDLVDLAHDALDRLAVTTLGRARKLLDDN